MDHREKKLNFLPVSKKDLQQRGWKECDFLLISGDAYVDHPSFGAALIGRVLEAEGFKIGIIPQPQNDKDFLALGIPKIGIMISSGNMDSMVNRYTANRKLRSKDSFSPGGKAGLRPDRALIPYSATAKKLFKGKPVILGGIEASLRRLAHYDYWSDSIRRSILWDSKADFLVYGMAERTIVDLCKRLSQEDFHQINDIPGTVVPIRKGASLPEEWVELPDFTQLKDKEAFAQSFMMQFKENNPFSGRPLIQRDGTRTLLHNPPATPLNRKELDRIYSLPFLREFHPIYKSQGGVPALQEVLFSITGSRGCFGRCSFCAIAFHQGEIVQSRSHESILKEASTFIEDRRFKGIIHDVGGPTANFRHPSCQKQAEKGPCTHRSCLYPKACPKLDSDQGDFKELLKKIRNLEGVKKIFIRSGIRYDYLLEEKNDSLMKDLCQHHISGQLKVAPEHCSPSVLKAMNKPSISTYRQFKKQYEAVNQRLGKKQYLIPYLIASHPGTTLKDAIEMACFLKEMGFVPDQVQDFYPTPGTLSSVMYYTGLDPRTGETIVVPKGDRQRARFRALMQYNKAENFKLVREALIEAGRRDLIGLHKNALVPPSKKKRKK